MRDRVTLTRTTWAFVVLASSFVVRHAEAGEIGQLAIRLGLTPERLIVAGAGGPAIGRALELLDAATTERSAESAARVAVRSATSALATAEREFKAHPEEPLFEQQMLAARQSLADARSGLQAAVNLVLSAGLAELPTEVRTKLSSMPLFKADSVPASFLALERTESEWSALIAACTEERRCVRSGLEVPTESLQLLADARSDSGVVEASIRLSSDLEAVRQQFADR